MKQFLTPSVDTECKKAVVLTSPKDARVVFALVGVLTPMHGDRGGPDKDNEVGTSTLFNEAQQALNRARL